MKYPLPRGSNSYRTKMLWELGLHIAGNPTTPYGGDRDMCIVVGNGSGDQFRPALRMATGSPILALDVARGGIDMAIVNPSGFLTQAYRGVGLFKEKLDLRVIAVYPSWDRFVFMLNPRLKLKSLREIRDQKYPLYVSVKEDPTHSTRVFIDQVLAYYDFCLDDIVKWGGRLNFTGPPNDERRMSAMASGELDAIFDEGLSLWFQEAIERQWRLIDLEDRHFQYLTELGWRKVTIPAGRYRGMDYDHACIDYSGWPLYTRADLPEKYAFEAAEGIFVRKDQIVWQRPDDDIRTMFADGEATPMDVPLHPGVAKFLKDHGGGAS
jgi:TRAP-type uncharacterized transport system substrate-binding protein